VAGKRGGSRADLERQLLREIRGLRKDFQGLRSLLKVLLVLVPSAIAALQNVLR